MSNRIRVAVVGIGNRGSWALDALQRAGQFEVAALVDPIGARVEYAKKTKNLPSAAGYADLATCLARTSLDAVAVFTPDGMHAEPVEAALHAGKWVFVEKPLEITNARLDRIIEADRQAGGKTFVGFNLRFAPVYTTIKRLLDEGVAGEILTVEADEFYDGGRTYFRRWNRLRSVGGGLWVTKSCHDFDLLHWLVGAAPTGVFASCALRHYRPRPEAAMYCRDCRLKATCPDRHELHPLPCTPMDELTEQATGQRADLCLYNSDKDTFDSGQACVRFANGAMATYTVSVVAGFTNRRFRVAGTQAVLEGDMEAGTVVIRRRDPSGEERLAPGSGLGHGGADEFVMDAFAGFIRGKPAPHMVRPAEAAVAVRIGLAATQSCDEGRFVSLV